MGGYRRDARWPLSAMPSDPFWDRPVERGMERTALPQSQALMVGASGGPLGGGSGHLPAALQPEEADIQHQLREFEHQLRQELAALTPAVAVPAAAPGAQPPYQGSFAQQDLVEELYHASPRPSGVAQQAWRYSMPQQDTVERYLPASQASPLPQRSLMQRYDSERISDDEFVRREGRSAYSQRPRSNSASSSTVPAARVSATAAAVAERPSRLRARASASQRRPPTLPAVSSLAKHAARPSFVDIEDSPVASEAEMHPATTPTPYTDRVRELEAQLEAQEEQNEGVRHRLHRALVDERRCQELEKALEAQRLEHSRTRAQLRNMERLQELERRLEEELKEKEDAAKQVQRAREVVEEYPNLKNKLELVQRILQTGVHAGEQDHPTLLQSSLDTQLPVQAAPQEEELPAPRQNVEDQSLLDDGVDQGILEEWNQHLARQRQQLEHQVAEVDRLEQLVSMGLRGGRCHECDERTVSLRTLLLALARLGSIVADPVRMEAAQQQQTLEEVLHVLQTAEHLAPTIADLVAYLSDMPHG